MMKRKNDNNNDDVEDHNDEQDSMVPFKKGKSIIDMFLGDVDLGLKRAAALVDKINQTQKNINKPKIADPPKDKEEADPETPHKTRAQLPTDDGLDKEEADFPPRRVKTRAQPPTDDSLDQKDKEEADAEDCFEDCFCFRCNEKRQNKRKRDEKEKEQQKKRKEEEKRKEEKKKIRKEKDSDKPKPSGSVSNVIVATPYPESGMHKGCRMQGTIRSITISQNSDVRYSILLSIGEVVERKKRDVFIPICVDPNSLKLGQTVFMREDVEGEEVVNYWEAVLVSFTDVIQPKGKTTEKMVVVRWKTPYEGEDEIVVRSLSAVYLCESVPHTIVFNNNVSPSLEVEAQKKQTQKKQTPPEKQRPAEKQTQEKQTQEKQTQEKQTQEKQTQNEKEDEEESNSEKEDDEEESNSEKEEEIDSEKEEEIDSEKEEEIDSEKEEEIDQRVDARKTEKTTEGGGAGRPKTVMNVRVPYNDMTVDAFFRGRTFEVSLLHYIESCDAFVARERLPSSTRRKNRKLPTGRVGIFPHKHIVEEVSERTLISLRLDISDGSNIINRIGVIDPDYRRNKINVEVWDEFDNDEKLIRFSENHRDFSYYHGFDIYEDFLPMRENESDNSNNEEESSELLFEFESLEHKKKSVAVENKKRCRPKTSSLHVTVPHFDRKTGPTFLSSGDSFNVTLMHYIPSQTAFVARVKTAQNIKDKKAASGHHLILPCAFIDDDEFEEDRVKDFLPTLTADDAPSSNPKKVTYYQDGDKSGKGQKMELWQTHSNNDLLLYSPHHNAFLVCNKNDVSYKK